MIEVIEVGSKRELREFVLGPVEAIYRGDPCFVPPILRDQLDLFDPKKTPFFKRGEVRLLLARKDGRFAGRLSVQTNREHDRVHGPGTGFFGFSDFVDDPEVPAALFAEGERLLRALGMRRVMGPFNFDINSDCGLLVEGFDDPPAVLMTHNPPWYAAHLERLGYRKEKDLLAWRYEVADVPELARVAADVQRQTPGLVLREADPAHLERDIRIVTDIYNDAWSDNWGALPIDEEESRLIARHLKPILRKELILFAELDGQPVGVSFGIPDINRTLREVGRCNSWWDLARFLWRLRFHPPTRGRLVILGIRKAARGKGLKYLSVLLYVEMNDRARKLGITGGECSWTLEDNVKINRGIELMGGKVYKKYRIYGKELAEQT